jgi:hypothetical protein
MNAFSDDDSLRKLVVELPENDQASAEVLWGRALGGDQYQLRSVPIWAYGLAFDDVVEAKVQSDERYHITRVVKDSGLLTVRIAGPDALRSFFEDLIKAFASRAVATEHFSKVYSAFAMASADYAALLPLAENAEKTGLIFIEVANEARDEDHVAKS